ncbi:MAG TPA: heparan-alpha-glucosaminide N-acetyltransferase domain-containing protein [Ignavibacteriaceae bacterium]|nr:heparan-alpha-glucosaminide N-acetyltransferase domain-containing protein [Ignavibacteriaceae bacterium]
MTLSSKKNRIIFIDLMRAFAVLQMVQGHTTDVLLAGSYRSSDFPVYAVWLFMRGMTAPIFMFSAGTVFTYLFRLVHEPFEKNPRTKKGFKRVFLLVALGYILRYPTATVVDFSQVTADQWKIFLAVDVLQCIGMGILFLLICAYIAEKLNVNDYLVFAVGALFFFLLSPILAPVDWKSLVPVPIAGYLYKGTGSQFPLFPWVGFVVAGGVFGSYLAKNPMVFKTAKFSYRVFITGAVLLGGSLLINAGLVHFYSAGFEEWPDSPLLSLMRLGFVLILNSVVAFISLKVETIPRFLILVGRNTLLIYIVHLMILYGSAWNPGLIIFFNQSLSVWNTVELALGMLLLMSLMVIAIHKLKIKNKQFVTQ